MDRSHSHVPALVNVTDGFETITYNRLVWGAMCLVGFVFVWLFVPETKDLTLEQVDEMFEEVPPWRSRQWARDRQNVPSPSRQGNFRRCI